MPRFTSAMFAVAVTPIISFGQPCGMSIRPAVMRISARTAARPTVERTQLRNSSLSSMSFLPFG